MMDVQPADPRAQRRALVLVVSGLIAGVALIWAFERGTPALRRWITEDPALTTRRIRIVLGVFTFAVAGPPVAFGAYLWRVGLRVRRSGRFPPPGLAMISETPILTGEAAVRRAAIFQALGAIVAAVGLGIAAFVWKLARAIG